MRSIRVLVWTAIGAALVAGVQWSAAGPAGLDGVLPAWAAPLLPLGAFLLFGLFLLAAYGAAPGAGQGLVGALAALVIAALPVAYTYGIAQRYGLPASGGSIGTLLAGPYARELAALWFPLALASAFRRSRSPRGVRTPAEQRPGAHEASAAGATMTPDAAEPAPFWSPAPPLTAPDTAGVAYTPRETERA